MEDKGPVAKHALIIVSVFGRGHWLAASAADFGIPTTLIDVSEQMGHWAPEDWEGPFGQFLPESYSKSQQERLHFDDEFLESVNGFTFWLKDGPLELKGATSSHRLKSLGFSEDSLSYIQGQLESKKLKFNYRQHFLAYFAHHYASARQVSPLEELKMGYPSPLFSKFGIKMPTRKGLEKGFEWLRSKKVQVISGAKIKDVSFDAHNLLSGIEINQDRTWVVKSQRFAWLLTSEETSLISGKLVKDLYPKGVLEPVWSWLRYRFKIEQNISTSQLPLHFVMIDDIEAPLTHENFIIVNRTASTEQFDFWLMVPSVQRFNKSYMTDMSDRMQRVLLGRLPGVEMSLINYPQEYNYTYNELGPSRNPVFSRASVPRFERREIKNLIFSGPEHWEHLSQEGQYRHQNRLLEEMKAWWTKLEELRVRSEQRQQLREQRERDKDRDGESVK